MIKPGSAGDKNQNQEEFNRKKSVKSMAARIEKRRPGNFNDNE
jgi:hypothetical protein